MARAYSYKFQKRGSRYKNKRTATVVRAGVRRLKTRKNVQRSRRTIPRAFTPFPETRLVRHRYVENVTWAGGTAGNMVQYNWGANDMFDPNVSSVGHQPMYRDEMAARYRFYTVIASFIKVTFDQTAIVQSNYGILVTSNASPSASARTRIEQNGYTGGTERTTHAQIVAQRNSPLVLRQTYNAKTFNKTSLAGLMSDDGKKTASGSSPNTDEKVFYNLWAQPMSTADSQPTTRIQVELIYVCMWREPTTPVES